MAVIEHRDIDGVMGAFKNTGLTKWALWQGATPVMVYDGDDAGESDDKLMQCLQFIEDGGTTAVYALRAYNDSAHDITNKTPYKCATRFQLTSAPTSGYQTMPDGKVMVIRDGNRSVGTTSAAGDPYIRQLIESQNKTNELIMKMIQQKEGDRMDKLIGFLEQSVNKPAEESMVDKLVTLGKDIIDKPDIIDRIGYIFRPSIYQRVETLPQTESAVNGTTNAKKEDPPMEQTTEVVNEEVTEQEAADQESLDNRIDDAMDAIEEIIGPSAMAELLECLARQKPDKLKKLNPAGIDKMFMFI